MDWFVPFLKAAAANEILAPAMLVAFALIVLIGLLAFGAVILFYGLKFLYPFLKKEALIAESKIEKDIELIKKDLGNHITDTNKKIESLKTDLKDNVFGLKDNIKELKTELKEDVFGLKDNIKELKTELKDNVLGLKDNIKELKEGQAKIEVKLEKKLEAGQNRIEVKLDKLLEQKP